MIKDEIKLRVRYNETDRMGYVYHGVYAVYFEKGRTEMVRKLGMTYREMEDEGCIMPVSEMNIRYKKPALYDDLLTIETTLHQKPTARITFVCRVLKENGDLVAEGTITLVFADAQSKRPRRPPRELVQKIEEMWQEGELKVKSEK